MIIRVFLHKKSHEENKFIITKLKRENLLFNWICCPQCEIIKLISQEFYVNSFHKLKNDNKHTKGDEVFFISILPSLTRI